MHRTNLTSRFLAGWEPATLPPRGPDGMIPAPPPRSLPVIEDPPSLCEAGPCRHYHRVQSLMDAQEAIDGTAAPHPQVTRACYPTAGIEIDLGDTPVLRCSRWEPDNEQSRLDSLRDAFLKSPAGKVFADKLKAFDDAIEAERAKLDQIDRSIADEMTHHELDAVGVPHNPGVNVDANGQPAAEVDALLASGGSGSLSPKIYQPPKAVADALNRNIEQSARGPLSANAPSDEDLDAIIEEDGTVML